MSTIAPPSKPLSPALVDSEHYIDDQIRRTRRALKLVDLAAGLITLAIGLLAFALLAAVLDHWVVPGGLNTAGRGVVFGLMLLAVAWYGWRQFVPLLRSINPVYAAHTIERSTPSLKNSLLNLLMFRTHRQQMSTRVYHALEQQAAQRLSTATLDTAIDRSALLRLGYALLLIIAACAAYAVLSPKNMAVSAARVLAPWSDLAPPSRVKILDVKPGATSVARGERLEISAEVNGLHADESVRLLYSTADETLVNESITMKRPTAEARRFQGELPRGGDATVAAGVEKDLVYWIEAGDARSKKFKVTVFERPTLVVQKVRYEYPAYTGFPTAEVGNTGDVRGLEGTQVTIAALANQPIKSAYVDFDADGRSDLKMTIEGDRATASFALALREDRRTPQHGSYVLKFTSVDGRTNIDPPKYDVDVTPDYAPEVRVTSPEEPELTVRVDEMVPISIEARDPDFALSGVRLVGKVGDREATLTELLTEKKEGRYGAIHPFTPGEVKLKPGDVLEYWAEARDNRRPEANVALSEHRRLKIAGPADQQQKNQKNGEPASAGGQDGQQKDGQNGEGGQQGQGGPQQEGEQGGESEGGEVGENQGQEGPGGAGAKGKQGDKSQSQEGTGGQGGTGQSQSNDQQQQQEEGGGAGGSSANNADQSQNPQEQPSQGASNGAGNSGQPQAGQQKPQPGANPGESGSAGGPNDQTQPGAQGQPGSPDGAKAGEQNGEQPGAPQEKVSSDGDNDAEAFNKLAEQLNKQDGGEQTGESGAEGEQPDAKTQADGAQGGQRNAQQRGAQPGGEPKQDAGQGADGKQGQSPQDKPSGAAGQSQKPSGQKPAEGAQPEGPAENATDADQQGAAGQNPSKRQGAEAPRETKNGDGNPNDPKDGQPPSADSMMNRNDGNAGSGRSAGEQDAAPGSEDSASRGKEKTDADNQKGADDQEAPGGSADKQESNSSGAQGGDRSGGGQKGAGQKADAAGKGAPGQHEAADEGAGRADEQGKGETGAKAGGDQLAEGKTGESSGDKPGEGTQEGAPGESASAGGPDGQQAGAKSEPKAGEQPGGEQEGPQGVGVDKQEQPTGGEQPPQPGAKTQAEGAQPGGEQGAGDPTAAKPPQAGEKPDSQDGKPGEQQPSQQPSGGGQAGSSQPQGGGQGGEMTASAQQATEEAKEDEANLDFARKQTDLVLERLDQQLAKKQVDAELLKSLGWSEADLQKFVNRWKDLKTRAASEGDEGEQAQQELDGALRSLGLRQQGPTRVRAGSKADELKVKDSYRSRAPIEYAERVNRYRKNLSVERGGEK